MSFDGHSRTPPLVTVQNVGIEIARIYRKTNRGEISTPDGYRMVQMLAVLKQCLETTTLEQRLAELEALVAAQAEQHEHFRPRIVS
jgi:hypothetical protein